jgi:hypothetical protein
MEGTGGHPRCIDHPTQAVARCTGCSRAMCDECLCFEIADRPACAGCAHDASTRRARRVLLSVSFLAISWGLEVWLAQRYRLWDEQAGLLVVAGALAATMAGFIAATATAWSPPRVEPRRLATGEGHPYRAHARRVLRAATPHLSGKATALTIAASFLVSAGLVSKSLHFSRWIEAEMVLGAWWLITASTLAILLYRGFRLRNDYAYALPGVSGGAPTSIGLGRATERSKLRHVGRAAAEFLDFDVDGFILVAFVALSFGAAWLFVEVLAPILFSAIYWLLMRAIGRVANDGHHCEHHVVKAAGWGTLWASIYLLPLALLTWIAHVCWR